MVFRGHSELDESIGGSLARRCLEVLMSIAVLAMWPNADLV